MLYNQSQLDMVVLFSPPLLPCAFASALNAAINFNSSSIEMCWIILSMTTAWHLHASTLLTLYGGICHQSLVDSRHKGPVMQNLYIFFVHRTNSRAAVICGDHATLLWWFMTDMAFCTYDILSTIYMYLFILENYK